MVDSGVSLSGARAEGLFGRNEQGEVMRADAFGDEFLSERGPSRTVEEVGGTGTGATMELSLLGGSAFSVGGDALLGISAGSQRLLALLALRDHPATRSHVAGKLWTVRPQW